MTIVVALDYHKIQQRVIVSHPLNIDRKRVVSIVGAECTVTLDNINMQATFIKSFVAPSKAYLQIYSNS